MIVLSFTLWDMADIHWATNVDPNQPAHQRHLFRIYTVYFYIHKVIFNQKANSLDPDQMPCDKNGIYEETGS